MTNEFTELLHSLSADWRERQFRPGSNTHEWIHQFGINADLNLGKVSSLKELENIHDSLDNSSLKAIIESKDGLADAFFGLHYNLVIQEIESVFGKMIWCGMGKKLDDYNQTKYKLGAIIEFLQDKMAFPSTFKVRFRGPEEIKAFFVAGEQFDGATRSLLQILMILAVDRADDFLKLIKTTYERIMVFQSLALRHLESEGELFDFARRNAEMFCEAMMSKYVQENNK